MESVQMIYKNVWMVWKISWRSKKGLNFVNIHFKKSMKCLSAHSFPFRYTPWCIYGVWTIIMLKSCKHTFTRFCRKFENLCNLSALSGKFLRQKSCCPESFRFFWLWCPWKWWVGWLVDWIKSASCIQNVNLVYFFLSHICLSENSGFVEKYFLTECVSREEWVKFLPLLSLLKQYWIIMNNDNNW